MSNINNQLYSNAQYLRMLTYCRLLLVFVVLMVGAHGLYYSCGFGVRSVDKSLQAFKKEMT